jgi:hypothetical protein
LKIQEGPGKVLEFQFGKRVEGNEETGEELGLQSLNSQPKEDKAKLWH